MKDDYFPLDKILTINAEAYFHMVSGKTPASEFTPVGVHADGGNINVFRRAVPRDAAVVVDYRCTTLHFGVGGAQSSHSGTALVPSRKKI